MISALVAYEFVRYYPQPQRQQALRQLERHVVNEITPIDAQTSLDNPNEIEERVLVVSCNCKADKSVVVRAVVSL